MNLSSLSPHVLSTWLCFCNRASTFEYKYMITMASLSNSCTAFQTELSLLENSLQLTYQETTEMAMKWASFRRRRMSLTRTDVHHNSAACGTSVADKGHFVVYTSEGRRFVVPLSYLHSSIFSELLRISEEEYGLARDGPITLPCDASSMEYMLSLLRRKVPADVERALLSSILEHQSSSCSLISVGHNQQVPLCIF